MAPRHRNATSMVLISGHQAKVWATVAAPVRHDLCMNVRRVIFSSGSGRTPGCCSTARYFTPIALKLRHGVPSFESSATRR